MYPASFRYTFSICTVSSERTKKYVFGTCSIDILPIFCYTQSKSKTQKERHMKKLGFGMMRLPLTCKDDPTTIDIEQTKKMVDTFIERGFTYFDTAWMYHKFRSENAVKEVLTSRYPRDAYTLATKLHTSFIETKEDRDRVFNEQLCKCGVDYFDYYLMHDQTESHYEKAVRLDCFNWLREKKKAGLVRHMGFSFHDSADMLDKILTEQPDMEFVQLQINYLDWESENVQSRKCWEVARRHGKQVVIMEPVKGGTLANVPESVEKLFKANDPDASVPSWAIRFAAGLDGVMVVLSGMSSMEQMLDNTSFMQDFVPLTDDQIKTTELAAKMINSEITVPCTGCSYCTDGCPMQIPIPKCFDLYNKSMFDSADDIPVAMYATLSVSAADCLGCGQCESICPQHLPIIENLAEVADHFA